MAIEKREYRIIINDDLRNLKHSIRTYSANSSIPLKIRVAPLTIHADMDRAAA